MESYMLVKDIILSPEKLPFDLGASQDSIISGQRSIKFEQTTSHEDLTKQAVAILKTQIENRDKKSEFLLGQLLFLKGDYQNAKSTFENVADDDFQAMYQLSVLLYDGVGCAADCNQAVELMFKIAESRSPKAKHLVHPAEYNIGRAYFQGFGVPKQSDIEAEKWWLRAAADGNSSGSILAQTTLGFFYTRQESRDLKKAFFWHSEACGNGSLESQGALGVMYLFGLGVKKNLASAFMCLVEAAERGNVYAMGHLAKHYFDIKLFNKAAEIASRCALLDNVQDIAIETQCLPGYVSKGISLASFVFGRCLHRGLGVKQDEKQARFYYNRSYRFDPDVCAKMQSITIHGQL